MNKSIGRWFGVVNFGNILDLLDASPQILESFHNYLMGKDWTVVYVWCEILGGELLGVEKS